MNNFFDQLNREIKGKNPAYIRVKVIPKSSKNEIVDIMDDGTYKVRITGVAENNKANLCLIKFFNTPTAKSGVPINTMRTLFIRDFF